MKRSGLIAMIVLTVLPLVTTGLAVLFVLPDVIPLHAGAGGVDRIMFDNFSPEMTRKAVEKVAGRCETESSGGITLSTMRDYAECGVDFISVGALTHQIKSLDMSLKACE